MASLVTCHGCKENFLMAKNRVLKCSCGNLVLVSAENNQMHVQLACCYHILQFPFGTEFYNCHSCGRRNQIRRDGRIINGVSVYSTTILERKNKKASLFFQESEEFKLPSSILKKSKTLTLPSTRLYSTEEDRIVSFLDEQPRNANVITRPYGTPREARLERCFSVALDEAERLRKEVARVQGMIDGKEELVRRANHQVERLRAVMAENDTRMANNEGAMALLKRKLTVSEAEKKFLQFQLEKQEKRMEELSKKYGFSLTEEEEEEEEEEESYSDEDEEEERPQDRRILTMRTKREIKKESPLKTIPEGKEEPDNS